MDNKYPVDWKGALLDANACIAAGLIGYVLVCAIAFFIPVATIGGGIILGITAFYILGPIAAFIAMGIRLQKSHNIVAPWRSLTCALLLCVGMVYLIAGTGTGGGIQQSIGNIVHYMWSHNIDSGNIFTVLNVIVMILIPIWLYSLFALSIMAVQIIVRQQLPTGIIKKYSIAMAGIVVTFVATLGISYWAEYIGPVPTFKNINETNAIVFLPPKDSSWTQPAQMGVNYTSRDVTYRVFPPDGQYGNSDFGASELKFIPRNTPATFQGCKDGEVTNMNYVNCEKINDSITVFYYPETNPTLVEPASYYVWYVERGSGRMEMGQSVKDSEAKQYRERTLRFINDLEPASQQRLNQLLRNGNRKAMAHRY